MKLENGSLISTYIPVACLVVFALMQIDRAERHDQSPWQGGGFGMFSTNDRVSLRQLRVYAIEGEEEHLLRLPRNLRRHAKAVTSYPSERNLLEFARKLAGYKLQVTSDAIRVEVWKTRFDSATASAALVKVREATHQRRK